MCIVKYSFRLPKLYFRLGIPSRSFFQSDPHFSVKESVPGMNAVKIRVGTLCVSLFCERDHLAALLEKKTKEVIRRLS